MQTAPRRFTSEFGNLSEIQTLNAIDGNAGKQQLTVKAAPHTAMPRNTGQGRTRDRVPAIWVMA